MTLRPETPQELQEIVRSHENLLPRGGGTKTALSTPKPNQTVVNISGLTGVLEYDPSEFVFVAKAGTTLKEIQNLLAQNGQYLPFDPPFAEQGATLGGTVAAGLSGSLRQRYGGVRDFILGVQFVDGAGNLVRGGGKVVKNSAGFDTPKLMVGSLGQLGILTEVAFKVFPFPKATATVEFEFENLEATLGALYKLSGSHFEFYAFDLAPPNRLVVRIGGLEEALPTRLKNLQDFVGQPGSHPDGDETQYWSALNDLNQLGRPPTLHVVKVALTPKRIAALEPHLNGLRRRYLSAGNLLYVGTNEIEKLDMTLNSQGLSGLVITGTIHSPHIGVNLDQMFGTRVRSALLGDNNNL